MSKRSVAAMAVAFLTLSGSEASAAIITFSDRTAWALAAVGNMTTLDFEGIAAANNLAAIPEPYLGVTFQPNGFTSSSEPVAWVANNYPTANLWGSGSTLYVSGDPAIAHAFVPGNVFAVGFDIMTFPAGEPMIVGVELINHSLLSMPIPTTAPATRTFFGVTSDIAILTASFCAGCVGSSNTQAYWVDNFSYVTPLQNQPPNDETGGPPAPVPEPMTLWLVATGAGIGFAKRRYAEAHRRS